MLFLTITGALTTIIWLCLLIARGSFWRARRWLAPEYLPQSNSPRVVAVVPARNEAEYIAASVRSLLEQGVDVFLVDDHSTDSTAAIARSAADASETSARLTVIQSKPLPPGWSGKLWAVKQGVDRALKDSPDYLLLTDADIVHGPDAVSTLTALAADGCDLVSFMVKLVCRSLAEKLLIPAFVFFFFLLYPPAWIGNSRRKIAGAAGGCILIRPEALARAGGLEAIRGEIIDDCALARAVKHSGGRVMLRLTNTSASVRPYQSFAAVGRMISRTAFNQLRHSMWLLLATMLGLCITYLAPPLLLASGKAAPVALGALAWVLMAVAYLPIVRLYSLQPCWAFSLPLAALFYLAATVHSAYRYWSGKGGEWKGRMQDTQAVQRGYSPEN